MLYAIAVVLSFAAGYALCKLRGPKIDAEAGVIEHMGVMYFSRAAAAIRSKL